MYSCGCVTAGEKNTHTHTRNTLVTSMHRHATSTDPGTRREVKPPATTRTSSLKYVNEQTKLIRKLLLQRVPGRIYRSDFLIGHYVIKVNFLLCPASKRKKEKKYAQIICNFISNMQILEG
ncbi:hypothetical protein PUN28_003281 [Cardiocondyla obscurior]|uniref:Uncharacterized protein n=1 Tax=Cardiocondyla obscurior TaxID=286306 RepID=A0AAW2GI55_9HYME